MVNHSYHAGMTTTANAGTKYVSGRKGTEIAKLIRNEIRDACKVAGPLNGCKVSVRFRWATHSKAIDIEIQGAPFNVMNPTWVLAHAENPHRFQDGVDCYSAELRAAEKAASSIAAQYNRFDSDSQTDYFNDDFFQHVSFAHDMTEAHTAKILCSAHPACCGCSGCEDALAA